MPRTREGGDQTIDPYMAAAIALGGAALGTLGTVVVTWLRGHIEFRQWQRQQRVEAYSGLLHATDNMVAKTRRFATAGSFKPEELAPAERAVTEAFDQMASMLSEIEMVGSPPVVEAAVRIFGHWQAVILPGL